MALSAWFLAKFVKHLVERGRPLAYLPDINVREGNGGGLGFVSGHTAVAFAVATALLPILPPKGRVVAYALATLVGLARIVYGVHLVVDVIGGAALGIMCGCVVDLLFKVVPSRRPSGVASAVTARGRRGASRPPRGPALTSVFGRDHPILSSWRLPTKSEIVTSRE